VPPAKLAGAMPVTTLALGRDIDLFGQELSYHVSVPASVVLLALASAFSFAFASATQHAVSQTEPRELSLRLGLLLNLLHRPLWLAGNVADAVGYILLFLAFRRGSLALVEPLLAASLLFALPVGVLFTRQRLRRGDLLGAALVVGGLSGFLIAAAPGPGRPAASAFAWLLLGGVTTLVVGGLIITGGWVPQRRAAFLGMAAGALNGVLGALTEAAARSFDSGIVAGLQRWQPYAVIAVGVSSILVVQSAFQAGRLSESLPLLTATETLVGITIGQAMYGERIASEAMARIAELGGLLVLCWGIALLGRSPLVAGEEQPAHRVPRSSAGD